MTNNLSLICQTNSFNFVSLNSSILKKRFQNYLDLIVHNIDFEESLNISSSRKFFIKEFCVDSWYFPSHDLSYEELIYVAFIIIQKSCNDVKTEYNSNSCSNLSSNSLNDLVPSNNKIICFLLAVKNSYHAGNKFHNFRHAIDVLQATYFFLIKLNLLSTDSLIYAKSQSQNRIIKNKKLNILNSLKSKSITQIVNEEVQNTLDKSVMKPIEVLGLLLAALGHDTGHPGLTNLFLCKHESPLSTIFNETSVLENYHYIMFEKLITNFWTEKHFIDLPKTVSCCISLKNLITESILATDMAKHSEYITKIKHFKELANEYNNNANKNDINKDEIKNKIKNQIKEKLTSKLLCSLIIKCADISNVTRPLRVSTQWGIALGKEFGEIATLESLLTINKRLLDLTLRLVSCLKNNPELYKGQIFFINTFALELFKSILEIFPNLRFAVGIIEKNVAFWEKIKYDIEINDGKELNGLDEILPLEAIY
ncbi:3',5'-cyclic-nucleotide phosphodiesterase PDE2 [Ascoidea rubescens DSM 1968]|uniref:HD-domain/PDEase-like protein n=1 Tax=Ascoidea rubescens DSM 1968 TaxID=1344418 RepID=A0A1D2VRD8_9ASCO|nr:HD-domain/PDEase-like protein [Ascoidea rubescens DSM 1968]ODV64171.1 HD-domain/PDEase-like protein [Ascoidea rubescens DSM 1968]